MNISSRDRRAIILGGAAVGSIVLYFFAIEPAINGYLGMLNAHKTAAENVKHAVRDARQLASFQSQIKDWETKAGPLVPTKTYSEQITTIGSRILTAAGESGVQLQGATPTTPTPWVDPSSLKTPGMPAVDKLEQALVNVDAQGDWESVFKFVAALYHIEGVLSVEQMDLNNDGKGGPIKIRLSVSVLMKASSEGRRV